MSVPQKREEFNLQPASPWTQLAPSRTDKYMRWTFQIPGSAHGDINAGAEALLDWRKECIREREFWLSKKAELGRFAKDMAREWMTNYRGACLMIGYVMPGELNDCPYVDPYVWPEELHRAASIAGTKALLAGSHCHST